MLLASVLKKRVMLQEPVMTPDTAGGYARTWQDVAELWARIEPLTGRDITNERLADRRVQARVTHRLRLRWRDGVTAEMRLLHGSRLLYIRAVVNVEERGKELEVLAEEGA